ncbi:MAG: portal protein, partial [Actinomycetes bacterium]
MTHTVLVIGATDVGRRTCAALQDRGTSVIHLDSPTDTELRELLLSDVSGVAIMLHNDIEALRYALTIEHIRPGIRLFVAIFDRSVRHEMERTIPNCSITS